MKPGDLVTANLREPREQFWGLLVRLDSTGIVLRGIDAGNFEQWCRQLAGGSEPELGPTTVFFPSHRLERATLDERVGSVPSMEEYFRGVVGADPRGILAD